MSNTVAYIYYEDDDNNNQVEYDEFDEPFWRNNTAVIEWWITEKETNLAFFVKQGYLTIHASYSERLFNHISKDGKFKLRLKNTSDDDEDISNCIFRNVSCITTQAGDYLDTYKYIFKFDGDIYDSYGNKFTIRNNDEIKNMIQNIMENE